MRWALPMDDIRLTRSLLDQGYNHLDLRLTPTWMASSSEYGVARTPWKPLGTTYWHVALAATDTTCQYVMRSGAARYMARASYTSTLPPEPRTGHPFAFVAASSRDSALMIE